MGRRLFGHDRNRPEKSELPKFSSGLRALTMVLSAIGVAGIIAWIGWSVHWLIVIALAANLVLTLRYWKSIEEQVGAIEKSAKDLALLAGVLARLEREKFSAPLLVALRERLHGDGPLASQCIAKLNKLIQMLESRRNQVVAGDPVRLCCGRCSITFAIVGWRRAHGPSIRKWLETVGELEALSDLAGYAFEHPPTRFRNSPTEHAGGCFDAEGFCASAAAGGSRDAQRFAPGPRLRLMVISGPNMAGKSTFLRGVGVNAVLAQCGAPVRAKRLRMSPLTVGASICVLDSLQGGVSRFYAEIQRLKVLVGFGAMVRSRCCFCWMSCCRGRIRTIGWRGRGSWCGVW